MISKKKISRPTEKSKKKASPPTKSRIKPKMKEDVCYSTEAAVAETLCCCEDIRC